MPHLKSLSPSGSNPVDLPTLTYPSPLSISLLSPNISLLPCHSQTDSCATFTLMSKHIQTFQTPSVPLISDPLSTSSSRQPHTLLIFSLQVLKPLFPGKNLFSYLNLAILQKYINICYSYLCQFIYNNSPILFPILNYEPY